MSSNGSNSNKKFSFEWLNPLRPFADQAEAAKGARVGAVVAGYLAVSYLIGLVVLVSAGALLSSLALLSAVAVAAGAWLAWTIWRTQPLWAVAAAAAWAWLEIIVKTVLLPGRGVVLSIIVAIVSIAAVRAALALQKFRQSAE